MVVVSAVAIASAVAFVVIVALVALGIANVFVVSVVAVPGKWLQIWSRWSVLMVV